MPGSAVNAGELWPPPAPTAAIQTNLDQSFAATVATGWNTRPLGTPLLKARIPDWRAMVDVVMIDTAYDGEVFNITLSDVPEKKDDLVSGRYDLPAPEGETCVAVKVIDMLGEEAIVAAEV